jgi:nucleotidyltransferase substrate binding protein (TIGR01987 family)
VDRLTERRGVAVRALSALEAVLARDMADDVVRDAAIQRFEFALEAGWKAAQQWLRQETGDDVSSPKGVVRALAAAGRLDEDTARMLLAAVDDRNLTVHTYSEATARHVAARLSQHATALRRLADAVATSSAGPSSTMVDTPGESP